MNDAAHVGEPDTGALEFVATVEPLEDAEQLVHVLHVEADAVVANEHHRLAVGDAVHADFD